MHCEDITLIMSDLLDKTLSVREERDVRDHLSECESCRSEFQKLKKVDDILREVVCEMVSGIEVPADLSRKIEKNLAREQKKKSLAGRFTMLLKTPAAAAALLFIMVTAVILSFHNPFSPSVKQSDVAPAEPQVLYSKDGITTDSSGPPVIHEEVSAGSASVIPEKSETRAAQEKDVAGGTGGVPEVKLREQTNPPMVAQVPQVMEKSSLPQEKRPLVASSGFAAAGAPAYQKGTLEEAAREVGFNPARPAYLPQGTALYDVTWLSGTVNQNYRTGQIYFAISQSRTDVEGLKLDEGYRQGTSIEINGAKAVLQETEPKAGENSLKNITVRWQRGEWMFSVSGGLPRAEIIRIASSLS